VNALVNALLELVNLLLKLTAQVKVRDGAKASEQVLKAYIKPAHLISADHRKTPLAEIAEVNRHKYTLYLLFYPSAI
jgi:hypothetical protein